MNSCHVNFVTVGLILTLSFLSTHSPLTFCLLSGMFSGSKKNPYIFYFFSVFLIPKGYFMFFFNVPFFAFLFCLVLLKTGWLAWSPKILLHQPPHAKITSVSPRTFPSLCFHAFLFVHGLKKNLMLRHKMVLVLLFLFCSFPFNFFSSTYFIYLFYFTGVSVSPTSMSMHHVGAWCPLTWEVRVRHHGTGIIRLLGTKLRPSAGTRSVFNHWAICPVPLSMSVFLPVFMLDLSSHMCHGWLIF